jgi:hypothetical protein
MDDKLIDFITERISYHYGTNYEVGYSKITHCNCCYEFSIISDEELKSIIKKAVEDYSNEMNL